MSRAWCLRVMAAAALATSACSAAPRPEPIHVPAIDISHLRVKVQGVVRRVALEDYVRATVISEFAPAAEDPLLVERMLQVQAVIARTYALSHAGRHRAEGFDLCATTHCQLYEPDRLRTSKWADAAREATGRTAGMVLWHDGRFARAIYHADCGGHISAAADIWRGPAPPYLAAARDGDAAEAAHTTWQFEASATALAGALNASATTRVAGPLQAVTVLQRDRAGRALLVELRGRTRRVVRGEDFRAAMSRGFGAKSVRSTSFTVRKDGGRFLFHGRGFGHGVGLCQAGALARLRAGAGAEHVLARYYPGTRLVVVR